MSIWYGVDNPEDIELSDDGQSLEILYYADDQGNHYVEVNIEALLEAVEDTLPEVLDKLKQIIDKRHGC